jgi:hypothetical protein
MPQVQSIVDPPIANLRNEVLKVANRDGRQDRSGLGRCPGIRSNGLRCVVLRCVGIVIAPGRVLLGIAADAQHALRAETPKQADECSIPRRKERRMPKLRGLIAQTGEV